MVWLCKSLSTASYTAAGRCSAPGTTSSEEAQGKCSVSWSYLLGQGRVEALIAKHKMWRFGEVGSLVFGLHVTQSQWLTWSGDRVQDSGRGAGKPCGLQRQRRGCTCAAQVPAGRGWFSVDLFSNLVSLVRGQPHRRDTISGLGHWAGSHGRRAGGGPCRHLEGRPSCRTPRESWEAGATAGAGRVAGARLG